MRSFLYIIGSSILISTPMYAQNALGTGRALDNNLSGNRENPPSTLPRGATNLELRRNSVLSGRGFNTGIGFDTRTHLQLISDAADMDDASLEDTMNNSPWYWDNWNNQSTQYLSQGDTSYFNPSFTDNWAQSPIHMRIGQSMQSFAHAWSADDGGDNRPETLLYPESWSNRQIEQHHLSQATGSTYEPSQNDWTSIPVGNIRSAGRVGYITASPLRGVSVETSYPASALGLTAWDAARTHEDVEQGIGSDTLVNHWVTKTGLIDNRASENQLASTLHDSIMDLVSERAKEQLSNVSVLGEQPEGWLDQQYSLLQGQLAGTIPIDEEDEYVAIEEGGGETEPEEDATSEIAFILQHGQRIEQLASNDTSRFNELVQLAQDKLAAGEYFWAERRFDRALRFIPGHPLATAGLGHARIGAGLYLSASLALQSLLSLQPEMIDVQYAPSLLPPRIELVKSAVLITSRLEESRDGGTYGFLLAYIGHQLSDREMIVRGLSVFEEREGSRDPLVQLLKRIWL